MAVCKETEVGGSMVKLKKYLLASVIFLTACGSAVTANESPSITGTWNWGEVKVSDAEDIGSGHRAEVCAGDVEIYSDGTCEMSERCSRDEERFFPYVYTVDCEWEQKSENVFTLRMYAPDRTWYQNFVAIGNKDRTTAVILRMSTHERSFLIAFKTDNSIVELLGELFK